MLAAISSARGREMPAVARYDFFGMVMAGVKQPPVAGDVNARESRASKQDEAEASEQHGRPVPSAP